MKGAFHYYIGHYPMKGTKRRNTTITYSMYLYRLIYADSY
jgi:hypothetical protein